MDRAGPAFAAVVRLAAYRWCLRQNYMMGELRQWPACAGVHVQDATHPLLWRCYPWRIIFFQLYPYSEFGPTIIYLIVRACARGHAREHLEGGLAPSRRNTVKHGTVVVQKAFIESRSSTAGNHFRRPLLGLYPTCSRLWESSWLPLGLSGAFYLFILDCIFRWWCSVGVLLFGYPCDGGPTAGAQIGGGYVSDLRSGDSRWADQILAVKIAWYW